MHRASTRKWPPTAEAQAERFSEDLMEQLDVGVIVQDRSSAIIYSNRKAAEMLNVRREDVLGRGSDDPLWDVIRADGSPFPHTERPVATAVATGNPVKDVVLGVRLANGRRSWILANAIPKLDASGEVEHVVTTLSDISSERRRMGLLQQVTDELEQAVSERTGELAGSVAELQREVEQRQLAEAEVRAANLALERSRAQFERVTKAVPGVLYQALRRDDGSLELSFVSGAARDVLGLDAQEIIARPDCLLSCIEQNGRQTAKRRGLAAQHDLQTFECEVQLTPAGQEPRWIHNRAVPQRVDGGVVWSGVAYDVTEQRRIGDEVRAAQRREAIGTVTAGIAHNFNNALAVIVPNLEASLREVPACHRRPLKESLRTAQNAADLVRQLMVVARGGLGDERVKVDLSEVLRQTAAMFRPLLRGRVEVRESNSVGHVRVDSPPSALHQVLLNLCINARDALHGVDGGFVHLSLEVCDRGEPGARAIIRVRDNGPGMDEETRAHLGEPFFTTKSPGTGTGLGLATAYATVRELGGEMECISAPGEGCEFVVSLPVVDYGSVVVGRAARTSCSGGARAARLLLVDDEPLVRHAIAEVLARRGHVVDQVGTGVEALERIRSAAAHYDAVLLDLSMPGLSGEAVLARLEHEAPELPVMVLSGFVEDPTALDHARVVLHKPVATRTLTEALRKLLQPETART